MQLLRAVLLLLIGGGLTHIMFGNLYLKECPSSQTCQDPRPPVASPEAGLIRSFCPRTDSRLAVVVPFFADCDKANRFVQRWHRPEFFPCNQTTNVDLIFSSGLSSTSHRKCDALIQRSLPPIERCFRSVEFVHEGLEHMSHDYGSKAQFVQVVGRVSQSHNYFFLMETDTHPIRSNWLEKLEMECWCGDDFLMKGSQYRMGNANEVIASGWHINGNALYNVNSSKTQWLIDVVGTSPMYDVAFGK